MNPELANTGVPDDGVTYQTRRLRSLRFYPDDDRELIRVVRESTPKHADGSFDFAVLEPVISRMIEDARECPAPCDVRAALLARWPQREPDWMRHQQTQASGFTDFVRENKAIMERAKKHEQKEAEMRRRIKHALGIRDLYSVHWGAVLYAKHMLGYELNAYELEAMEKFRAIATPDQLMLRPEPKQITAADIEKARKAV